MSKYLIVYGTKEGQTAKIAERIGDIIRQLGHTVDIFDARNTSKSLSVDGYNGILVGSSIHMMQWSNDARNFVRDNITPIKNVSSAFFSVSMAAAGKDPKAASGVNQWVQKFLDSTSWHPKTVGNFAGCLAYTKYGFITRWFMKSIAWAQNQPTDTSKDYEYTDWDQVKTFAEDFVQQTETH